MDKRIRWACAIALCANLTIVAALAAGCSAPAQPSAAWSTDTAADAVVTPSSADAVAPTAPTAPTAVTPPSYDAVAPTAITPPAAQVASSAPVPAATLPFEPPSRDASDEAGEERKLRFEPLSTEACEELALIVSGALGAEADWTEQPFLDYVDPAAGSGCAILTTGTGVEFGDIEGFPGHLGAADAVRSALGMQGWIADPDYGAGAPNAVASGLRNDDSLCLLVVRWQPSDDADCPAGRPFDECDLTPEQRLYHVELNCAQNVSEEGEQP